MSNNNEKVVVQSGLGLGAIIAVAISFSCNHSILWAILHGLFGWFYVIYRGFIGGY